MDNRTRNIEIAVGVFVLVCVAVAVTVFSVMLQKENAFEPRITVSAVFENARGLRPGAPVWVSGISVGSVQWVGFDEGDRARVIISLLSSAQQRVHTNAVARIVPMSLVGADTMIMLAPGAPPEPLIADGDTLTTKEMPDMYDFVDTAAPSLEHLTGLLANLEDLTDTAVASKGAFEETLKKAANIVDAVESGQGTLGALITDRTIYNDAVRLVAASADAAEEIREVAEEIREVATQAKISSEMLPETLAKADEAAENARTAAADLVALIDEAESVVSNANEFLEDLKLAADDVPEITRSSKKIAANIEAITDNLRVASDGVPALVEASREGVEEATGVLEAAKSTWLLRSYFPEKKPDTSVTIDRREGITPSR